MINNLSQFKKAIQLGVKVGSLFHKASSGTRDEKGQVIYRTIENPVRKVSKAQSTSFALATEKQFGEIIDSWCYYPKANECTFENNKMTIWETERDGSKTEVLTYWIEQ